MWLLGKENWWSSRQKADLCLSFFFLLAGTLTLIWWTKTEPQGNPPNTTTTSRLTICLDAEQSRGDLVPSGWLPSCGKQTESPVNFNKTKYKSGCWTWARRVRDDNKADGLYNCSFSGLSTCWQGAVGCGRAQAVVKDNNSYSLL